MNGPGLAVAAGVFGLASAVRLVGAARSRPRPVPGGTDPVPAGQESQVDLPLPPWFRRRVDSAGLPWPATTVAQAWLLAVLAAVAVGLLLGGPPAAAVLAGAVAGAPLAAWPVVRDRGRLRFERSLPGALETIAAALRTGASPVQAVAEAARTAPGGAARDLGLVATAARRGTPLPDALAAWRRRRQSTAVALVVEAMTISLSTGGAQGRAIDGVATTLRQRLAVEAEARALGTQARVSALVIVAAPPVFGLAVGVTDGRTVAFLFGSPLGLVVLAVGLALDVAGGVWMASLTRSRS